MPAALAPPQRPAFDVERLREDFPILRKVVRGKPLVYLDNAATSQKPQAVIDALSTYYQMENANIHRGVHWLSQEATRNYEAARETVRSFLNAREDREIIFTRGTTEAINLVAQSWGRANVRQGDEILLSTMEHHSNIVPWQMLCGATGAKLRVIPITDAGEVDQAAFLRMLSPKTRLLAIVHVSNALGTIVPVKEMIRAAHEAGALALVDGAQAVPHMAVDVQDLDCDFYAFSAHKVYGPTGAGALYGRAALLEAIPPWQGGGDMISSVTFEKTTYNVIPHKFEAGTPNIGGGIAMARALDYVREAGIDAIAAHEHDLLGYATEALGSIDGLRIVGTAPHKAGVVSFTLDGIHPHDIGTILDHEGIAVRTGHHCAQPVMDRFGIPATARASFALYNTRAEIDALVRGIHDVQRMFRA